LRIAITGGAGFIGHNLALYLAERGYGIAVIDTSERATPTAVRRLRTAGIPIYRMDARDLGGSLSSIGDIDFIVHSAAYVSVEESLSKPELYFENNAMTTLSIARLCTEKRIPIIYFSSAAVYGEPLKLPIGEDHPLDPISPYGLSKLFGEEILKLYSKFGLKYTILRLFNVYGPGQSSSYAGVVSRFIESALKGSDLTVYGDGSQTRDFVHVRDVARAVELALEKQAYGEVLNIGSGRAISIRELAELMRRSICPGCQIVHKPARPGDIRHSCADISRAQKVLGYQPSISLEEGIRELAEFFRMEGSAF